MMPTSIALLPLDAQLVVAPAQDRRRMSSALTGIMHDPEDGNIWRFTRTAGRA